MPRYEIPENVSPSDMECLTFFVPNDPLYIRQLITTYEFFSIHMAWEKDELKRGAIAARAWKAAVYESWRCNYMPAVNVTVNNNSNGSSGGCGCCGPSADRPIIDTDDGVSVYWSPEEEQTPTYTTDPYVDPEDGTTESPLGETNWVPFNEEKCRRANYFADNVVEDLQRAALLADSVVDFLLGDILKFFGSFIPKTWRDTIGGFALQNFAAPALIEADDGNPVNVFEVWADNIDREPIVKALYEYTTQENAYDAFHSWADGAIASLPLNATQMGYLTKYKSMYTRNMFRIVTDFVNNWPIPSSYVGITDCLNPPPDLEWDFEDNTLQGWIFQATDPFPSSTHTGQLVNDAIDGNHSIDIDYTGAWNAGVSDAATWRIQITPNPAMTEGDTIEFDYDYVGLGILNFQITISPFGLPAFNITEPQLPAGNQSGRAVISIPTGHDGDLLDFVRIRPFVESTGPSQNPGRIRIDNIGLRMDSL